MTKPLNADWRLISGRCKPHVCVAGILVDLTQDMLARGCEDLTEQPAERCIIETPRGAKLAERHAVFFNLDGLDLVLPAQDFTQLLFDLKLAPMERLPTGRTLYRLHGDEKALVLLPEQRDALLRAMEAAKEEAVANAERDDATFSKELANINKKLVAEGYTPVESIHDLEFQKKMVESKRKELN